MQVFSTRKLYRFHGSKQYAPEGFNKSPMLAEYLNYLVKNSGERVFTVTYDDMWYTIVLVKEVS